MRWGLFMSRHVSERTAQRLAWLVAGLACRAKPAEYCIARANLLQVLGPGAEEEMLGRTIHRAFSIALRGYYDLYRALCLPRRRLIASVELPERTQAVLQGVQSTGRGLLLVFPHLGNFDLGGQVLGSILPGIQLLTLPNPSPGLQFANDLRRKGGVEVTPLSSVALRQALARLRQGGVVALAADRPVSELDDPIPFFGRPARVPSGHVRLALKTDAQIVVVYCVVPPGAQKNTLYLEPPLNVIRTGVHSEDVSVNMHQVLGVLESVIRRWLDQWRMFVPVWPELLHT
jgi:KDO2-lipid IV(A) lauroyltransferase